MPPRLPPCYKNCRDIDRYTCYKNCRDIDRYTCYKNCRDIDRYTSESVVVTLADINQR
jgi:hypothetical protein